MNKDADKIDSSLRESGVPVDIDLTNGVHCPYCKRWVLKGVLGSGTRIQCMCKHGCKGRDGRPLKFPVVVQ